MQDRFEKLLGDAQLAVYILGNPRTSDFELVDKSTPLTDERRSALTARGMEFLGVAGLVDGVPQTQLDAPLDKGSVEGLSRAFLAHIGHLLNAEAAATKSDAVQWLADLYSANDPRPS
jgi:hypothetical protein